MLFGFQPPALQIEPPLSSLVSSPPIPTPERALPPAAAATILLCAVRRAPSDMISARTVRYAFEEQEERDAGQHTLLRV